MKRVVNIVTSLLFGFLLGGVLTSTIGIDATTGGFIVAGLSVIGGLAGSGLIGANYIDIGVSTWSGKQVFDYFIKPSVMGKSPLETPGVRVMPEIVSKRSLNYFNAVGKVLKKYQKGWTSPPNKSLYNERWIDVDQIKGEMGQDANEFYETVYEEQLAKGVDWNNVDETKELKNIIAQIWADALKKDLFRLYWFNSKTKEELTNGIENGTPDEDYNVFDGMWKLLMDNSSTTPTVDEVFLSPFDNGAVAQVDTVTITGTSGTANIAFNGINYLATFTTNLTTSAANFVTTHAAALLIRNVIVTSSAADIIFTSSVAGMAFTPVTITNVTGNLAGSRVATTANTAPADLGADEALTKFKTLTNGSFATLKSLPTSQKVLLVTDSVYENYLDSLEGKPSTAYTWTSEDGRNLLINGAEVLKFRGLPVVKMDWDEILSADFNNANPHRIIYTEVNNLVLGLDAVSSFATIQAWYDLNSQENRYRTQLKMGAQFILGQYTSIAV